MPGPTWPSVLTVWADSGRPCAALTRPWRSTRRTVAVWNNKGASLHQFWHGTRRRFAVTTQAPRTRSRPRRPGPGTTRVRASNSLGPLRRGYFLSGKGAGNRPGLRRRLEQQGRQLLRPGRYDEAIRCYDNVLHLVPEDVAAWYNTGQRALPARPARRGDKLLRQGRRTRAGLRGGRGTTKGSALTACVVRRRRSPATTRALELKPGLRGGVAQQGIRPLQPWSLRGGGRPARTGHSNLTPGSSLPGYNKGNVLFRLGRQRGGEAFATTRRWSSIRTTSEL